MELIYNLKMHKQHHMPMLMITTMYNDDDYKIVIMINDNDDNDDVFESDNAIDDNKLNYNEA